MLRYHVLRREQRLPGTPDEVFPFFSEATQPRGDHPPWLGFRVLTPDPIEMRPGALIEYRLKLHGLALSWLTRIEEWVPGERFVDAQLAGPYALWHHTHEFEDDGAGGTLMRDTVRYALPLLAARRGRARPAGAARPRGDLRLPPPRGGAAAHSTVSVPSMPPSR